MLYVGLYTTRTIRRGSRCSASKAFIRPVKNRENLHIAMNAYSQKWLNCLIPSSRNYCCANRPTILLHSRSKIIINEETRRAEGVKVYRDKNYLKIFARKEIIVSGGSINTPQLLMLSGIGPKDHLEEHGREICLN
ncbi:putative GMC-type oxidoreductase [Armadillidium vulgare]|nr:putative GMC-type oxidoreductase [Armadillidium vulgare]